MSDPISMAAAAIKSTMATIGTYASTINAGLSVVGAGTSFLSAKGQAEGQEVANAQANERARESMISDMDNMTRMGQQETAAASDKLNQNQIEATKTAATARASAGAGGVGGLSVDALLGDIYGQEAAIRDSVNQNLENTGHQMASEREALGNSYVNTVMTRPQPQHPSLFGAVLDGATGVMSAYKDDLRVRSKTGGLSSH